MKCPNCQTDNPEKRKFCRECGAKLIQICPQCGTENPPEDKFCGECGHSLTEQVPSPAISPISEPTSFAKGRYKVKKKLGEGGKKKVYLVTDTVLDRDVAFALIKTENLDEDARKRVTREARAMAKLGDHPNIMTIHDMGEEKGQPFIVIPEMSGGDVEALIEKVPEHRLPLEQAINISKSVCLGLEFAHSKGIVHRDIKPGNVWMSEDGTVKIGDFGLAMVSDVSRLTREGMMVGTVSYMPPEQAMGGEITEKADLYSLGAMLYEMVTGRPPFVGDDSIAIIGGHINTPPVSPTWHRSDLPPSLETLILQLLEKDPEKRPASAKDVYAALESIEASKEKEPTAETARPTENPLYRRVFVGRETELKQLQTAFDGAISGQGALVMVVGEPGIGKTAMVCEQLSTYVTLRGGKTLVGHCYEEGSLSLPYLAFVEAMRSYVLDRDPEDLRKELGTGATDVARIVSEIREKLKVEPRAAENPDEDKYRLLQAVASFLSNAAGVKPMLVVLEDLHDADKGTLEMLSYVSRNVANTRVLIVGTYRDVEVDRNHPLSAALAELRRVSSYQRVLLRGLNADEVRRMLNSITGEEVPWGLAEAVHRQTEGNPLFVQEVVRYLTEEKLLKKEGGKMVTDQAPLEMNIPEGLRDVIGKRLSNLSPECNQLLSAASIIGREFALDTLRAVVNINDDVFINALKEAVQLSILEERSQVGAIIYRFTHAFFRQTLYEEMIAPQRLQLHQQVARALEKQYEKRLGEHAVELAEHFSQSTDPADLKKAVEFSEMAANRASSVYAYGEAVRMLDQALKVQRVFDPDDKAKMCRLLLALSDALSIAGEPRRALNVELPEAFSLAEEIGDDKLAAQIAGSASRANLYAEQSVEIWREWGERADRHAEPNTIERAWADYINGLVVWMDANQQGQWATMAKIIEELQPTFNAARHLGDNEAFWYMSYTQLVMMRNAQFIEERYRLAEELAGWPRTGVSVKVLGTSYYFLFEPLLQSGQRERAMKFYNELKQMAERTGQAHVILLSMALDCVLATIEGRLEEASEGRQAIIARGEELGIPGYGRACALQSSSQAQIHLGKADEALSFLITYSEGAQSAQASPQMTCCLAYLNRDAEVKKFLEERVMTRTGLNPDEDMTVTWMDILYLESAVIAGHRQDVKFLLSRITNNYPTVFCWQAVTCTHRHLGAAAALLERYDEAREHYKEALRVATDMKFRPELALTRLQLAELLLEHYPDEKKEALDHLDFAIKEFREMKMKPSLERALRHKDILKA